MKRKRMATVAGLAAVAAAALLLALVSSGALTADGEPAETIHTVEGDVVAPKRLAGETPAYPATAKKEGVEGFAVVRAVIDREGKVASTEIVQADREDLGAAAAEAISGWTFEPATLDGEPVAVYYHLTVRFRLDGGDGDQGDEGEPEPSLR